MTFGIGVLCGLLSGAALGWIAEHRAPARVRVLSRLHRLAAQDPTVVTLLENLLPSLTEMVAARTHAAWLADLQVAVDAGRLTPQEAAERAHPLLTHESA